MNSMLNSSDIDANIPTNNHTIFNTVEPNNTSTRINSSTASNTSAYSNNISNAIQIPAPNIHECFESIKNGIMLGIEIHHHPEIVLMQEKFNNHIFNHKVYHCQYYYERWFDTKGTYNETNNLFKCDICKKSLANEIISARLYSNNNNMDLKLHLILNQLLILNNIKEMSIARVHVVISVY